MSNIQREILEKLNEIEKKENVKVLYAVESGSRAWGVESPDSDFDVRFVYARPEKDYLRLDVVRDVIEWQLDDVLDINGWDLKKTLIQFQRGNATLFEWANSPVVYKTTDEWNYIYGRLKDCFSEKVALYHYYGTARSTFEEYLTGDIVRYKKYIYALRPILACRYIEEFHCIPPVLFEQLRKQELPETVGKVVEDMLEIKERTDERDMLPQIPEIKKFIESEIKRLEAVAKGKVDSRDKNWELLNEIFINIIQTP